MLVDPAAEAMMAQAPVGTCTNDPTLAGCPPAGAVVYEGGSSFAPISGPATATISRVKARAAQIDQCAVRVTPQSPYKAAGYAQMDGNNMCSAAVTTQELYCYLEKFAVATNKWTQMDVTGPRYGGPGMTIRCSARYNCTSGALRAWRARAVAYALLEGIWYAGMQDRTNNLKCS